MYNTLDIAIRVEAWTVRTIAFARGRDQAQALVVTQSLLMHFSPLRRYADHIPCSIAWFDHDSSPFVLSGC
jgi:hypothetical protein